MNRSTLSGILLMLMAVVGALGLLFILGGGLMRALLGGAATSGIVSISGSTVRLDLVLVLAAVVIAVGVVLFRRVRR